MNTKIKFTYKDTPYVLEYNRYAIKAMEANGFSSSEFQKKPMINLELAFKGLFIKNHSRTSEKLIDEIYNNFKDKDKLIETIGKMINECYESLVDEGNLNWDIEEITPTTKK